MKVMAQLKRSGLALCLALPHLSHIVLRQLGLLMHLMIPFQQEFILTCVLSPLTSILLRN